MMPPQMPTSPALRTESPMLPKALLCHQVPGRFRVRVPDRRGDDPYFARIEAGLKQNSAALQVTTNPLTGSVLVLHAGDGTDLLDHAERAGLFVCTTERPPSETIASWLDRLDRFDAEVVWARMGKEPQRAATGLFMLAVLQALRGSVLPSAPTLLGEAMRLLRNSAAADSSRTPGS